MHTDVREGAGPAFSIPDPIPGSDPIAAVSFEQLVSGGWYAWAVLENGDVYQSWNSSAGWYYHGNMLGGPVNAVRKSWGGLKARYR